MINYREAIISDAKAACLVLVESINEICAPFYDYDEQIISEWLKNKTPSNVAKWIESKNTFCVVVKEKNIVGFSCISGQEIMLLYVTPEVLHKGVGKKMLSILENHALLSGIHKITTTSSLPAKSFYKRNGYVKNEMPGYVSQILGDFPLIKIHNK